MTDRLTRIILEGSPRDGVELNRKVYAQILRDLQEIQHVSGAVRIEIISCKIDSTGSYCRIVPRTADNDDGLHQVTVFNVQYTLV